MSTPQILFILGFLLVAVLILVVMLVMYARARRLDGGAAPRLATVLGLGPRPEFTEANRWAAYLHRATGVADALFLALHLVDVALFVWSAPIYEQVHALYGTTAMRIFECGLLFALLFHALNGLRLLAIDVWDVGLRGAVRLLHGVLGLSGLGTLGGSGVILWPILS